MTDTIKASIAALTVAVVVYLLAGFIAWNWDASTWDVGGRFYVALIGSIFAALAFLVTKTAP